LLSSFGSAATTDINQAKAVVRGWLGRNPNPLDTKLGQAIADTRAFADDNGQMLYYVVYLEPSGYVIVSSDDRIEPIIAFCDEGVYDPSPDNPLGALVSSDMAGRKEHLRSQGPAAKSARVSQDKWALLTSLDSGQKSAQAEPLGATSVSDVRVAPLVQSMWDQGDEGGNYCYNYYTPSHYSAGCVATGMAQLMRYHQHPTGGIGVHNLRIFVDGFSEYHDTIGGNGSGGPYQWIDMPLDPDGSTSDAERRAIGALCFDAGLTVEMDYSSGGSSASLYDAKDALTNATLFDYSNAVYGYNSGNNIGAGLDEMINTNLDAALPVALSVRRSGGGHVVLADGYGYAGSTLYHHINVGWGGSDNAWYDLPTIDTSSYTYNSVAGCIYNLFTSGTGEIISGRVTDMALNPIEGATVIASIGSTVVKQTTTNIKGIYALTKLISSQGFSVTASKPGHIFVTQSVATGNSSDMQPTSGNVWGVNFTAQNATAPIAYDKTVSALSGTARLITLDAADEGLPNPPGQLICKIKSLPKHGKLTDPLAGEITTVPYTLASNGSQVEYLACAYFAGTDEFDFIANDGGSPPQGDSELATITVEIDNHIYTKFEIHTNIADYWPLDTLYHDHRAQVIYLQSEIGDAKTITDLAINIYTAPGQTMNNWTIRMKHTTMSQYVGYPELEPTGTGWTIVYQNSEPATPIGWRNFSFQTPFEYNGTDNLLIDFSFNNTSSSSNGRCFLSDSAATRVVFASSNSAYGDPLDWEMYYSPGVSTSTGVPNLKLISKISAEPVLGDFGLNCKVDMPDLAIFALTWLTSDGQAGYNDDCDISEVNDDNIDIEDLKVLGENWLRVYAP
jgi:hypothetical protein